MKSKILNLLHDIENNIHTDSSLILNNDDKNPLENEQILSLVEALRKNAYIRTINLCDNNIDDVGAIALAQLQTIDSLNLTGNNIKINGFLSLAKSNINALFLGYNDLVYTENDYQKYVQLIDILNQNQYIKRLYLNHCDIPNEFITELIQHNKSIIDLYLSSEVDNETLKYIHKNNTLQSLRVDRYNIIDDVGAAYISQNLSLESLYIEHSNIGNEGLKFLAQHPTLKKLTLSDSNVTLEGAHCLYPYNLEEVTFSTNLKQDIMSHEEILQFNANFGYAKEYKAQLLAQQEQQTLNNQIPDIQDADQNTDLMGNSQLSTDDHSEA